MNASKYKVAELERSKLDAAVALAEGRQVWFRLESGVPVPYIDRDRYDRWWPSQQWHQGGPIIQRERLVLFTGETEHDGRFDDWAAVVGGARIGTYSGEGGFGRIDARGPTPLIAAMRAYVAHKLGDEVTLP